MYRSGHSPFALRHIPTSVGLRYTIVFILPSDFSVITFRNGNLLLIDSSTVKLSPEIVIISSFSFNSTSSSHITNMSSIYLQYSEGIVLVLESARFSTSAMKKLANVGPKGEPIDIPSHCRYILPSISRNGTSVVHIRSNRSNIFFGMTGAGSVG